MWFLNQNSVLDLVLPSQGYSTLIDISIEDNPHLLTNEVPSESIVEVKKRYLLILPAKQNIFPVTKEESYINPDKGVFMGGTNGTGPPPQKIEKVLEFCC